MPTTKPAKAGSHRIEHVPLGKLQEAQRNPKQHSPDIGVSIGRFGYVEPIVLDERTGRIVAGHGRKDALLKLKASGGKPPSGVTVARSGEWLVPVMRGWASKDDAEAEAYLIASNRLVEAGGWDEGELAQMLSGLSSSDALEGIGFSQMDIDALLASTGADDDAKPEVPFPVFDKARVIAESFAFFRKRGFPYRAVPLHVQMQKVNRLAATDLESLASSRLCYDVADSYHPHRFHGKANGMRSPVESFANDESLKHAIDVAISYGSLVEDVYFSELGMTHGTQGCANFRPGFAAYLYRRYLPGGGVVLDPSTGYGGRLVGWIASKIGGRYVGVDPSVKTHEGNSKLANALAPKGSVALINQPFEDVNFEREKLVGAVDFAFTSPPYFAKELYADEPTQSFARYDAIDRWRTGFLQKMLLGVHRCLKRGSFALVNIADVTVQGERYSLTTMTVEDAKAIGFKHIDTLDFAMQHRFGSRDDEIATEPVFVFKKER